MIEIDFFYAFHSDMAHETKGTKVTDKLILHFIIMILNIE